MLASRVARTVPDSPPLSRIAVALARQRARELARPRAGPHRVRVGIDEPWEPDAARPSKVAASAHSRGLRRMASLARPRSRRSARRVRRLRIERVGRDRRDDRSATMSLRYRARSRRERIEWRPSLGTMLALLLLACGRTGLGGRRLGTRGRLGRRIVRTATGFHVLRQRRVHVHIAGTGSSIRSASVEGPTAGTPTPTTTGPEHRVYRLIALIAPGWSTIVPFDDPSAALLRAR